MIARKQDGTGFKGKGSEGKDLKAVVLSAGVVVVRREGEDWRYLLLRAYNYWDFPKGEVKPGEEPLETAKREVKEETGIEDLSFSWGHSYTETPPYGRGKIARYYLAETKQIQIELPISQELGRPEHNEARWLGVSEARQLLVPRLVAVIDWAHKLIGGRREASLEK